MRKNFERRFPLATDTNACLFSVVWCNKTCFMARTCNGINKLVISHRDGFKLLVRPLSSTIYHEFFSPFAPSFAVTRFIQSAHAIQVSRRRCRRRRLLLDPLCVGHPAIPAYQQWHHHLLPLPVAFFIVACHSCSCCLPTLACCPSIAPATAARCTL
jgi:hypothetical protein